MEFVGKTVRKEFKGFGVFTGVVSSYDSSTGFFEIVYEDGDSEELELFEFAPLLKGVEMMASDQSGTGDVTKKPTRVVRRPKKRRRIEIRDDSGNTSANLTSDICLKENGEVIRSQDAVMQKGFLETLENECGVGEDFKETVSVNGNLNSTVEVKGVRSDNGFNLNDGLDLNAGLNSDDGLNLNDGYNINVNYEEHVKRSSCIDLNLDANGFEDNLKETNILVSAVNTQKREHCFDLNLDLEDEVKNPGVDNEGQVEENKSFFIVEDPQKEETGGAGEGGQMGVDSNVEEGTLFEVRVRTQMEIIGRYAENAMENSYMELVVEVQKEDGATEGSGGVHAPDTMDAEVFMSSEVQAKDGDPGAGTPRGYVYQRGSRDTCKGRLKRKRRKASENVDSATETVLRRSRRRLTAALSAQDHVSGGSTLLIDNEAQSSAAVGAEVEGKHTTSSPEESEKYIVIPSKPPLPPSSESLDLDGIPILDLFSVYAFLRSFSTLLFLSPFELEEFVDALKSKVPNVLLDFIHVSLLQTLRKHLEFLCDESSLSANNCLRSLNWDMLDLVTWPMFMVQYLLMHGSGLKPGFDLCKLKLFESDYYKQSTVTKVEILRSLCDDVIEVEAIRSEINRRSLATELNMDTDRSMKIETSKRRRTAVDVSGGSCLTEEVVAEISDWNSDECCLCKMDGNLICCDGCPAAYHFRCVGVASNLLPEGDWYCPECVIHKDKPWLKLGMSLRGAELLGVDPCGWLYYNSCGYLLVSNSCDGESSYHYYHRNDLSLVVEALKSSSDTLYNPIIGAILRKWDISVNPNAAKDDVDFSKRTVCSVVVKDEIYNKTVLPLNLEPVECCLADEINNKQKLDDNFLVAECTGTTDTEVSALVNSNTATANNFVKVENPLTSCEGSVETTQVTCTKNSAENAQDCLNRSAGTSNDSESQGKILSVGDSSFTPENVDSGQGMNIQSEDCGHISSLTGIIKGEASQGQLGNTYLNYYSFARTASLVAEELARKSSDKIGEGSIKSVDDIISAQLKAISKKFTKFSWPNIRYLDADAGKEKCGWCFSCKATDDDRVCFFNMSDSSQEDLASGVVGLHSKRSKKGHLIDVMCYILRTEERLQGFLLGPWQNPHYAKVWQKSVVKASDVASLKHFLLMLESNLRRLALSAEWIKHVDSVVTMGSASHVVTSSLRASSKHGIGRKRARGSDLEPNPSSNAAKGLGLFWWRGGKVSRELFNWKVLPRSLASKAARQAGCTKIPGILYPDSSEFAKRSKYVAWRAAVETSRSVEQLALQVRELDANIRWDDIENTNLLSKMDQYRKSVRPFKKVIIRRKCIEGTLVKYLLDFGKRRIIPDIVLTHGSVVEESSSGRKKFWLEESYVPLHLLKAFEEKRITRKFNKTSSGKLQWGGLDSKKTKKDGGFSYLFAKAERSEYYRCGHCGKDVLISEAVCCQHCKGFFHKRHVRKSARAVTAESTYTCHKCQDGKYAKVETKKGRPRLARSKKGSTNCRVLPSKVNPKASIAKKLTQRQKSKKDAISLPLRRSTRKVKCVSLQNKKVGGSKQGKGKRRRKGKGKGKQIKPRKGTSKKPVNDTWQKRRTLAHHSYWLNGLWLSRKPNDERVPQFSSEKLHVASGPWVAILGQPKCSLCCEPEFRSTLNYVCCEICGEWFHGDAFGLSVENIGNLIGYRCHKCLNRAPPVCPHVRRRTTDEAQICELSNKSGIECSAEVIALPTEVLGEHKFDADEESKHPSLSESGHKDQEQESLPTLHKFDADEESKHPSLSESSHKDQEQEALPTLHQLNSENGYFPHSE